MAKAESGSSRGGGRGRGGRRGDRPRRGRAPNTSDLKAFPALG